LQEVRTRGGSPTDSTASLGLAASLPRLDLVSDLESRRPGGGVRCLAEPTSGLMTPVSDDPVTRWRYGGPRSAVVGIASDGAIRCPLRADPAWRGGSARAVVATALPSGVIGCATYLILFGYCRRITRNVVGRAFGRPPSPILPVATRPPGSDSVSPRGLSHRCCSLRRDMLHRRCLRRALLSARCCPRALRAVRV
jgi:hypothetical protein